MLIIRPLLILIVFFGGLYYFREPLTKVAPAFNSLQSPYTEKFKKLFKEVTTATSSLLIGSDRNYIPMPAGTTGGMLGTDTSVTSSSGIGSQSSTSVGSKTTTTESVRGLSQVRGKTELLPVISNQKEGRLGISGIVSFTNIERTKKNVPALSLNSKLTAAAESKLQDMFKNQYFQHISPSGESVSDVARKSGYEYIVVGENLALGIFGGDKEVVAAWMASPGHKKNILDDRYQDIGIAVGKGMYQGREQWLIVQHFGKALSACVSPNNILKQRIESKRAEIDQFERNISELKTQIDILSGDAYTTKASEYNALVIKYNEKLADIKLDIEKYNESARVFNLCAGIKA